ncbi:uncharacterized protein HKW66_Vig0174640 [Vigna angularis]|uniref:Uncharacterized protein n=1 Tax=Phaseolus angularis TaxID=3914 RepID=A0A8T0JLU6_PHAAN|nr:uncharacterized protein HKW66_Vig0174640 [Vigna angularis]
MLALPEPPEKLEMLIKQTTSEDSSPINAPPPFSSSLNPNDSHPWPSRQVHGNGVSSTSASSASSRSLKTLSSFAHNYRIAIALIPSALFLVVLGGTPVVAILDALSLKPAAFFAVWFSLIFAQVAFFLSASSSLFAAFNSSVIAAAIASFTFLLGVWSSLQFKWLLLENPSIAVALERLLFACLPVFAAASHSKTLLCATPTVASATLDAVEASRLEPEVEKRDGN